MSTFLVAAIAFSAGFASGSYFKALIFGSQDWRVMRWDHNIFGYRKVPPGHRIKKDEDVFMCLKMDTEDISDEGLEVHGEDW